MGGEGRESKSAHVSTKMSIGGPVAQRGGALTHHFLVLVVKNSPALRQLRIAAFPEL